MAGYRQLSKPPVAEALIDFRVVARDDFDPQDLKRASERLPDYPAIEPRHLNEIQFRTGPEPTVSDSRRSFDSGSR